MSDSNYARSYVHFNLNKIQDEAIIRLYEKEHKGRTFSEFAKDLLFTIVEERLDKEELDKMEEQHKAPPTKFDYKNTVKPSHLSSNRRNNISEKNTVRVETQESETDLGNAVNNLGI